MEFVVSITHYNKLSEVSYDPLSHSRHNARDRSAKVGPEITSLSTVVSIASPSSTRSGNAWLSY